MADTPTKKFVGFIGIKQTWSTLLPTMLAIYTDSNIKGRKAVTEEFERMAKLADLYVDLHDPELALQSAKALTVQHGRVAAASVVAQRFANNEDGKAPFHAIVLYHLHYTKFD